MWRYVGCSYTCSGNNTIGSGGRRECSHLPFFLVGVKLNIIGVGMLACGVVCWVFVCMIEDGCIVYFLFHDWKGNRIYSIVMRV